jgi:hypothetical protein
MKNMYELNFSGGILTTRTLENVLLYLRHIFYERMQCVLFIKQIKKFDWSFLHAYQKLYWAFEIVAKIRTAHFSLAKFESQSEAGPVPTLIIKLYLLKRFEKV